MTDFANFEAAALLLSDEDRQIVNLEYQEILAKHGTDPAQLLSAVMTHRAKVAFARKPTAAAWGALVDDLDRAFNPSKYQ